MSYSIPFRLGSSFRVVTTIVMLLLLSSTQSMAWQNVANRAYYPQPVYNSPYYPYPASAYYQPYNRGYLYSPQATYVPANTRVNTTPYKKRENQTSLSEETRLQTEGVNAKKKAFIDALLPHIQKENARLKQLHQRISRIIRSLDAGYDIPERSKNWLQTLAKKYRVKENPVANHQARLQLLQKIDIIPASLTLAQAANESAWGKSRFATEANNLFGIWTYDKSKGLKPMNREAEKKHLVRKFENMGESVRYYMHMLNSHPAYAKLRDIRYQARLGKQTPNGLAMATGLEKYSAKGKRYIQLIQALIRQNQWAQLDKIGQQV